MGQWHPLSSEGGRQQGDRAVLHPPPSQLGSREGCRLGDPSRGAAPWRQADPQPLPAAIPLLPDLGPLTQLSGLGSRTVNETVTLPQRMAERSEMPSPSRGSPTRARMETPGGLLGRRSEPHPQFPVQPAWGPRTCISNSVPVGESAGAGTTPSKHRPARPGTGSTGPVTVPLAPFRNGASV